MKTYNYSIKQEDLAPTLYMHEDFTPEVKVYQIDLVNLRAFSATVVVHSAPQNPVFY